VGFAAKTRSAKEVNALEHGLIAPLGSVVVFALNAGATASEVVAQLTGFDSPLPSSANL
jgi:Flp pilus assembly pilin Flp